MTTEMKTDTPMNEELEMENSSEFLNEEKEDLPEEKVDTQMEVAVPSHYNDDVYRDRVCDDDELRYQMIKRPVENKFDTHLYNFCDVNLEQRFRHVIEENKILPLETTKKTLTLKLRKNTEKERESIRTTINDTFETYYPEKILTFINSTVQLLFLERMRDMNREFTCVHKGTYYHILMTSHYKKVRFGRSYSLVMIDVTTSRFE